MTGEPPVTLGYRILDDPVTLTVPDGEASAAVRAILSGFSPHHPAPGARRYALTREDRGGWSVAAHTAPATHCVALTDALIALEWHLVTDMLAGRRDCFHLHGAALCAPSGTASILILGASGAGKTTLALALMARGFLPFADDVIVVDPDALAPRTFRRAFHVDRSTRALVEGLRHAPSWQSDGMPEGYFMPSQWAEATAPVRRVFFPTVRPGEAPAVSALSIAEAAATLLPFSGTLDQSPGLALSVAARLIGNATCYALRSGDLDATADLVASVTDRHGDGAAAQAPAGLAYF